MAGLLDYLQGASNSAAGSVSFPVDALAWALRKAGVPVGDAPIGGSNWMEQQGLTKPVPQRAQVVGDIATGLLGITAAAKAPQIARGLLSMGDNLAAPRTLNPQRGILSASSAPKGSNMETMRLYRAADDDYVSQGFSFAEDKTIAHEYTKNPGFGGRKVYSIDVPRGKVLDLTDADDPFSELSKIVGSAVDGENYGGYIARVVPTNSDIADALAAKGYDWIRLNDDFPAGAKTWQALSEQAQYSAGDAMAGLK